jgi:hypothetical protein
MSYKKTISLIITILFSFNSVLYSAPIQFQRDTLRAKASALTAVSDIQRTLMVPILTVRIKMGYEDITITAGTARELSDALNAQVFKGEGISAGVVSDTQIEITITATNEKITADIGNIGELERAVLAALSSVLAGAAEPRSSSAGTTIDDLSDYDAEKLLANTLLDYSPTGEIAVPGDSQAIIVYSDALDSQALRDVLSSVEKGDRRYYLVNKSDQSNEGLIASLGIARGTFDHIFQEKDPATAIIKIKPVLDNIGISQVRVFASAEADIEAWREQGIEALIMILKHKRFEIISNYTEQHMEYIRIHELVLIAA